MEERSKERTRTRKRVRKSSKQVMHTAISDLPCEILGDIFSRLPIKTILNCSTVCESWRKHFLDPDFAIQIPLLKSLPESFILRSNKQEHEIHRKLCLFDPEEAFCSTTSCNSDRDGDSDSDSDGDSDRHRVDMTISFKPDFGLPTTGDFELVNSCNGFLYLCDSQSRYPSYVLNPITGEYIKLPSPVPKNKESNDCYIVSRFGFSPRTNQYKVVRCFSNNTCNKHRTEIHTLGTGTWRSIKGRHLDLFSDQTDNDAFVNGCLHWFIRDCSRISCLIWSFNFVGEKFRSVPPPPCFGRYDRIGYTFKMSLGITSGCLSVSILFNLDVEIWIMKEYGKHDSWTKHFDLKNVAYSSRSFQPLRLSSDGGLFVLHDGKILASYKPRNDLWYKSFINLASYGIKNFQLVAHTPRFTSFRDIAMGENLKVFRANMRKRVNSSM